MTTTELDRLRQRNAELERQLVLAGLTPGAAAGFPDREEADALLALVIKKYPVLAPAAERAGEFSACLYWLAQARRREDPDTGAMTSYWIGAAERFLRARGWPQTSITVWPFAAAAVVSRVPFAPLTRFPHDLAWGLTLGDAEPRAWWRETLASGKLPAPTQVEEPRAREARRPSFIGGNHLVGDAGFGAPLWWE
jgi:hypothetical protein